MRINVFVNIHGFDAQSDRRENATKNHRLSHRRITAHGRFIRSLAPWSPTQTLKPSSRKRDSLLSATIQSPNIQRRSTRRSSVEAAIPDTVAASAPLTEEPSPLRKRQRLSTQSPTPMQPLSEPTDTSRFQRAELVRVMMQALNALGYRYDVLVTQAVLTVKAIRKIARIGIWSNAGNIHGRPVSRIHSEWRLDGRGASGRRIMQRISRRYHR
jgi:hypothetical protein